MFALEGLDWRSWSAADVASVTYRLLRTHAQTPTELRELFELVGDKDGIAGLDREAMGQTAGVEITDVGVSRG